MLSTASAKGRVAGWRHLTAQETAYRLVIQRAGARAAKRLNTLTASADWTPPDRDELVPLDELVEDFTQAGEARWRRVVKDAAGAILAEYGVSFDTTNPLIQGVFDQYGTRITLVSNTTRLELMSVLQGAYDEGASIDQAARALRDRAGLKSFLPKPDPATMTTKQVAKQLRMERAAALNRGRVIAITEINSAVNAASLAAVRITGAADQKVWLSASDRRVRRDHANANGQTRPLDQPFSIGGWAMQYPGDPAGPTAEVVRCRCTLTWEG